jgi:predicted transcriptional regulator
MRTMSETTITLPLDKKLKERLEAVAERDGRSLVEIARDALDHYLTLDADQIAGIEEAVRQADAGGPFVRHEEVVRWVRSWGTADELPRPVGRRR